MLLNRLKIYKHFKHFKHLNRSVAEKSGEPNIVESN